MRAPTEVALMKIKELYIENFGKLTSFRLKLDGGLNTVLEDNGFGKTTLSVFIKAMLYGLDDTKRASVLENERKRYLPWGGGTAGGWLTFETADRCYRIERSFTARASEDTFSLYDLSTGNPSADYSERLGEELFGIDADGFERTVFLSEKNLSGKNDNQTISAKLSDLVGVDGDIGGFDDAIKLLEEKRKYYQKRGGGGEIGNLKSQLEEVNAQILRIALLEEKIAERAKANEAISKKIEELTEKKKELDKLGEAALEQMKKQEYERQYSEMKEALDEEVKKAHTLEEFFKNKLPTFEEISAAEDAAKQSIQVADTRRDNTEYEELSLFFKNEDSAEKIADASKKALKLEKLRDTSSIATSAESTVCPFTTVPTAEKIAEYTALAKKGCGFKKKSSVGVLISFLFSIAALAVGIALGLTLSAICFTIAAIGAVGIAASMFLFAKQRKDKSASENLTRVASFIHSVYGRYDECEDYLSTLQRMQAELDVYLSQLHRNSGVSAEKQKLLDEIISIEDELSLFADKFPLDTELPVTTRIAIIKEKRTRYETVKTNEMLYIKAEENRLREAAAATAAYEQFVSLFPTVTGNPIAEVRARLAEYLTLRSSIARQSAAADSFAQRHGISANTTISANQASSTDTKLMIKATDEELLSLRGELHRGQLEIDRLESEIEKIDTYRGIKQDCEEKIALYTENLLVINKTKELLQTAKSNMTARYLDSTRRGFEKYMNIIDDTSDEYGIDTSFSVMKSDAGALRQSDMYSKGTRDLFAIAIRLSLIDALYEGDTPPIILDDPFSAFDDKRCSRALSLIKRLGKDRQIIYLTCTSSRCIK